jgi:Arc/MetJ family transcription regulator
VTDTAALHPYFVGPANAAHLLIRAAKALILPRSGIPLNSRNVMRNEQKRLTESCVVYYNVYWRMAMRTNIVLDDELVAEAFKFSQTISTKRELIETALKEYVNNRKRKNLKELKGKITFSVDYDYKKMREKK